MMTASTTTTTTTNIDRIWKELKNEDDGRPSSSSALHIINAKQHAAAASNKKKCQQFIIKHHQPSAFDIDSICSDELRHERVAVKSTTNANDNLTDANIVDADAVDDDNHHALLLSGLCYSSDANAGAPALGDSDDEEDDDNVSFQSHEQPLSNNTTTATTTSPWRIERVAKALVSDDMSLRIQSLTKLNDVINTLQLRCPVAPDLNCPPPYDDSQVKLLNSNLSLVSDWQHQPPRKLIVQKDDVHNDTTTPIDAGSSNNLDSTTTTTTSRPQLQVILNACGKPLLRLLSDNKSEKCRKLSLQCLQSLLLAGIDIRRHIPYIVPALCARNHPISNMSSYYDKDTEVFVQDYQMHQLYLRGGATNRQDRVCGMLSQVIELNEELRLDLCKAFNCLLRGIVATNAEQSLDAYYSDIILSLVTSLRDAYPEVKVEACRVLVQLLRIPHYEQGAKYFATGLARAALPNCRHRNTNVIIAAIDLFEASVQVPDRAKVKGAGTKAISDLVGFREENVSASMMMMMMIVLWLYDHSAVPHCITVSFCYILGPSNCGIL